LPVAVNVASVVADVAAQLLALIRAHRAALLLGLAASVATTVTTIVAADVTTAAATIVAALAFRRRRLLPARTIRHLLRQRFERGCGKREQHDSDNRAVHFDSFLRRIDNPVRRLAAPLRTTSGTNNAWRHPSSTHDSAGV
jgi:hypothetical protein